MRQAHFIARHEREWDAFGQWLDARADSPRNARAARGWQGLQPVGDNGWAETYASGEARRGAAGTSEFGLVQGGALEASNVDLTEQLVNMITAQRNFQANAQMIQTHDQSTQTVINLR